MSNDKLGPHHYHAMRIARAVLSRTLNLDEFAEADTLLARRALDRHLIVVRSIEAIDILTSNTPRDGEYEALRCSAVWAIGELDPEETKTLMQQQNLLDGAKVLGIYQNQE